MPAVQTMSMVILGSKKTRGRRALAREPRRPPCYAAFDLNRAKRTNRDATGLGSARMKDPLGSRTFRFVGSGEALVTDSDDPLRKLLAPIFAGHAEQIEAVLPPELRPNWRKAAAFMQRRVAGPKKLDHKDLLLRMAELDLGGDNGPSARELAAAALEGLPLKPGAGNDERLHVALPDGSAPGRKDLLRRLADQYIDQRAALVDEVAMARRLAERARKRAERLMKEGITVRPASSTARSSATPDAVSRALAGAAHKPRVTPYQVDGVRDAVRKAAKRS